LGSTSNAHLLRTHSGRSGSVWIAPPISNGNTGSGARASAGGEKDIGEERTKEMFPMGWFYSSLTPGHTAFPQSARQTGTHMVIPALRRPRSPPCPLRVRGGKAVSAPTLLRRRLDLFLICLAWPEDPAIVAPSGRCRLGTTRWSCSEVTYGKSTNSNWRHRRR